MRVVLTGGGFGGHASMAIAIGQGLRAAGVEEIHYIGCRDYIEHRLVTRETDFAFHHIRVNAVPRRSELDGERMLSGFVNRGKGGPPLLVRQLCWPPRLAVATLRSVAYLRRIHPTVVVAVGGAVCAPVVLAAAATRIRIVLHEANEVPGRTNRRLAPLASIVAVVSVAAGRRLGRRTVVTGNPVREAFARPPRPEAARRRFDLLPGVPTLLVTGGSLGAPPLNRAIAEVGDRLISGLGLQILHQTGDEAFGDPRVARERSRQVLRHHGRYRAAPYLDDFVDALTAADLVLTRAGAATLAEIACLGKPAIVAPFAEARDNHQWHNARAAESRGGVIVLAEDDLEGGRLIDLVTQGLAMAPRPEGASRMGIKAAGEIAGLTLAVASGSKVPACGLDG